jgi:hypothetical protein
MTAVFALAAAVFGSFFRGKRELVLRQQLAVYKRVQKRPRLRPTDRAFWAWLSRLWDGWKTLSWLPTSSACRYGPPILVMQADTRGLPVRRGSRY